VVQCLMHPREDGLPADWRGSPPAIGDGDENVAVGDCWPWRDVPCGAPVFLQEVAGFSGSKRQNGGAYSAVSVWSAVLNFTAPPQHDPGRGGTPMITTADAPAWLRRSDQAVNWARTMLQPRRAVVIDCETTDLPGGVTW